jgi:large subunit ribosomal protein L14
MLFPETFVHVLDNSGAKNVRIIRVLKTFGRRCGRIGDLTICAVQTLRKKGKIRIKKKQICYGLIMRTKINYQTKANFYTKFYNNAVILLNKNTKKPIGTRFFGLCSSKLRNNKQLKFLTLNIHTL